MTTASANLHGGIEHEVYIRRVRSGTPPIGGNDGWEPAVFLRCDEYHAQAGPDPGYARFTVITDGPLSNNATEDQLALYSVDDQVQVIEWPVQQEFATDTSELGQVVFEGVLTRRRFAVASNPGSGSGVPQESERLELIATALPNVDARSPDHTVRGRWVSVPGDEAATLAVVETPDLPAIFNFRGRPNRHATATFASADPGATGAAGLVVNTFTGEADPSAKPWRVFEAISSVLGLWLLGLDGDALDRSAALDPDLLVALDMDPDGEDFEGYADQYAGLDAPLPEVSIQGLGWADAIDRVCEAAGFGWACSPSRLWGGDPGDVDRSYILHLWAHNRGRLNTLRLPKRGTASDDAEVVLREQANVSRLEGMFDADGIINHVEARGPAAIEVSVILAPMWSPDDVTDPNPIEQVHQEPPEDKSEWNQYHNRHVAGGADFETYGHVGRAWGLDCLGAASADWYGSGDGLYYHGAGGFDFAEELGDVSAIETDRALFGVEDPIVWTRRVRPIQPLTRPEAVVAGRQFYLYVSEDGGDNWTDITGLMGFETLRDFMGIRLRVANLAAVNAATLGTDTLPAADESWWQLILDKQLLFELTCNLPADFAAIARSPRAATSSTLYPRAAVLETDIEQVWSHPGSILNTSAGWERVQPYGAQSPETDASISLLQLTRQTRDGREGHRVTASAYTWLMETTRFRLGDRITGVAGRGLDFTVRAGSQERAPSIDAITVTLGPTVADQGITLSLGDQVMRERRRR